MATTTDPPRLRGRPAGRRGTAPPEAQAPLPERLTAPIEVTLLKRGSRSPAFETPPLPRRLEFAPTVCTQCHKEYTPPGDTVSPICPVCIQADLAGPMGQTIEDAVRTQLRDASDTDLEAKFASVLSNLGPVVAKEMAERELARRRLLDFTMRFNTKYIPGWVHRIICSKLDKFSLDVVERKSPRLAIFLPPRHGKSELASINFPAKHLGSYPDHEVIACSYAVSLPETFSRRIKSIFDEPAFKALFPKAQLDPNAKATSGWHTTMGGGYLPAGVGGGITGRGAHVLIIDDPVKDAEEADSPTAREAAWNWYTSTARTRLSPGAGVLMIQTRWNDDDLSGRILAREAERAKKEGWEVLTFPAIAEADEYWSAGASGQEAGHIVYGQPLYARDQLLRKKGEALHHERYSLDELEIQRSVMPLRFWSALYQQNPTPDDGEFFKASWFRYEPTVFSTRVGEFPTYIAWDLSSSSSAKACYTVGVVGCLDYEGNIHLLDMVRFRGADMLEDISRAESIIRLYKKHKPKLLGIENGQILQAIRPQLTRMAREERLPISYDETLKPVNEKTTRAQPLQGIMQHGQLILPRDQPWVEDLQKEFLRFPSGATDDIVDAVAWLVRMMIKEPVPRLPQQKKPPSDKKKRLLQLMSLGKSQSNAALDA